MKPAWNFLYFGLFTAQVNLRLSSWMIMKDWYTDMTSEVKWGNEISRPIKEGPGLGLLKAERGPLSRTVGNVHQLQSNISRSS